jgi:putative tricarboxylic transport membrane protein
MWAAALEGFYSLFELSSIIYLIIGAFLGLLFGIMPGLGGPTVLALLIPITFGMDPAQAIILLTAAMGAVPFGGSITAILLNTPGTPQNVATTFDGYPLARQGKAGMALGAAATASALGAVFGVIVLLLLIPVARSVVLAFSYPDYFLLAFLGLTVIAVVSQGELFKALIATGLGLMISFIGYDPEGIIRFTNDNPYLTEGISLVSVIIGVFAIAEMIELYVQGGGSVVQSGTLSKTTGVMSGVVSVFKNFGLFIRSSVIGTVIGVIPGVGGVVANFLAYMQAKQTVKDEKFGTGDIRGVIAPESANNAKDGGSLVPTVAFGIPGSSEMAVLLGAFILHGIEPGPKLMIQHVDILYALIFALVAANIVVSVIGLLFANQFTKLTLVPIRILAPLVFAISAMGALATHGYFIDLILAFIFGVLGYFMKKYGYSRIALVIALVLGTLAETAFYQTKQALGLSAFVTQPLSLTLIGVIILVLAWPFIQNRKSKRGVR